MSAAGGSTGPLLGSLFRSRKTEKTKTNLMIFIRPTILRDAATTALETNQKYNAIRDLQLGRDRTGVQLMPGEERPVLAPIEELRREPAPSGEDDR